MALWETRFGLVHLPSGRAVFAPPLAWGRSRGKGEPVLTGGKAWFEALRRMPLLKVALHPGDLDAGGAEGVLARVLSAGENVAYAEVFGSIPHANSR
jgi:hypothetical protein